MISHSRSFYIEMKLINSLIAVLLLASSASATDSVVFDLKSTYQKVYHGNLELSVLRSQLNGLVSRYDQLSNMPDPELSIETENFYGDNDGFNESENTFSISQELPLGGKLSARDGVLRSEIDLLKAEIELKTSELLMAAHIAYADIILSESQLSLVNEQIKFSSNILSFVKDKVKLGGSLDGERMKAETVLRLVVLEKSKIEIQIRQKKNKLAQLWGGNSNDITQLKSTVDLRRDFSKEFNEFPKLKVEKLKIELAKSNLAEQKTLSIPNITVSGGYRRFEDINEHAFVAGFSIPLMIFSENQGEVDNAKSSLEAAQISFAGQKSQIKYEIEMRRLTEKILFEEKSIISKNLLPDSKKEFNQMEKAYKIGRVGSSELIESRNSYFEVRSRKIENAFEISKNIAEFDFFTGKNLMLLQDQ